MRPTPCPGCEGEKSETFLVQGLDCATEAALIEGHLGKLAGVCSVRASPGSGRATVIHTLENGRIEAALKEAGFEAREASAGAAPAMSVAPMMVAFALTAAGFLAAFRSTRIAVLFYLP